MSAYDQFPKKAETVRYYETDFQRDKFPEKMHTLNEWRELTKSLTADELERLKVEIEAELLRKSLK